MYVCTYVYIYMYVCKHVCMHVCMHVCKHACMHACMYACMRVWLRTHYIVYSIFFVLLTKCLCTFWNTYLLRQRMDPRVHQHMHSYWWVRGSQDRCHEGVWLHAQCPVEQEMPHSCLHFSSSEAWCRAVHVCHFRLKLTVCCSSDFHCVSSGLGTWSCRR